MLPFDELRGGWNTSTMNTSKLVASACPTIADVGWSYYFAPSTIARGEKFGLDMFGFYFLGRGGVLGDVEAPVVVSAFGYFNPALITAMWDASRTKLAPRAAGREYLEAAHDFGRARLGDLELDAFVAASTQVLEAARRNVAGLSLFAGAAAEEVPSEPAAAAMHLLSVLREFRGSAHLVAVVAEGLDPMVAHYLRRPEMFGAFGWSDADKPEVTPEHTDALARADERTDRLVGPAYGVLDGDGATALLEGLEVIAPRLSAEIPVVSA
jgi:hypothetical protein